MVIYSGGDEPLDGGTARGRGLRHPRGSGALAAGKHYRHPPQSFTSASTLMPPPIYPMTDVLENSRQVSRGRVSSELAGRPSIHVSDNFRPPFLFAASKHPQRFFQRISAMMLGGGTLISHPSTDTNVFQDFQVIFTTYWGTLEEAS